MAEVEGGVGGAGLESAQDSDEQLGGAGQGQGERLLGGDAVGQQQVGELVGLGVELVVGEGSGGRAQGNGLGRARHLRLKHPY